MTKPKTFFNLPTEIRNEIYTLVAYHYETGGIISPLNEPAKIEASIGLLDGQRYPIKQRSHYYAVDNTPAEQLQGRRFMATTNYQSKHFCTPQCLKPPDGASIVCRQMREEMLSVFYGIHTFHLEMSNFEVTDVEGLPNRTWSPVKWWRAIEDTNLRRITRLSIVLHPTTHDTKELNIVFHYRWSGGDAEAWVERIELLAWEKSRRTTLGRPRNNKPADRHPSDMSRFEMYRLQKWTRSSDFEAAVEAHVKDMQASGLHVRALERLIAALEPWDIEYLRGHISLDSDLVVGSVKEGKGELKLKWDFLS